jgi:hypothetical protein
MKHLKLLFVVFIVQLNLTHAFMTKFGVVMSETFEICSPSENDAKALDLSEFELIALDDTDVRMNGTWKFLRDMSNSSLQIKTEKFIRNHWHKEVYDANRASFCKAIHDPKEAWYSKSKKFPGCPLGPGVRRRLLKQMISSVDELFR